MTVAQLSLADALRIQFEEGKAGEKEFAEALFLADEARSKGSARHRVRALMVLGEVLQRRFHAKKPDVLQRAIDTFHDLVDLATERGSHVLVKSLALEAAALTSFHDDSGDKDSVFHANSLVDRALGLIHEADLASEPELTTAFTRARYQRSILIGNEGDLRQAMKALQDLISKTPSSHPHLHIYWGSLGFYHRRKWLLSEMREDLDAGIAAYDEASKKVPDHHPLWHVRYGNYASALHRRYAVHSTLEDLDEAVSITRTVVDNMNKMAQQGRQLIGRDTYVQNLGHFLEESYSQRGKVELLDEAISVHLGNLPCTPPVRKSDALSSLARAYLARFGRQGRLSDLDSAISLLEQSLAHAASGSVRISVTNHLANALLASYDEYKRLSDLERAIAVLRDNTILPDQEAHRTHCSLLGIALLRYSERCPSRHHLEESIRCQQLALQHYTESTASSFYVHYRLGLAEYQLFLDFQETTAARRAIDAFDQALSFIPPVHPDRSKYLVELGRAQLDYADVVGDGDVTLPLGTFREAAMNTHSWIDDRHAGAVWWAKVAHRVGYLRQALEAYHIAISFLPEVASLGLEHELRMRRLSKQSPDLCQDAAACAIEMGELELAVELLEASKTALWNMAQDLRADLSRLQEEAPHLAQELAETSRALEYRQRDRQIMDEGDRESEHRRLQRLALRRTELILLIRKEWGFEHFLLPASYVQLSQAAVDGPIIVLNASSYRCDALLVRPSQPVVLVTLPSLRHDRLRQDAKVMMAISLVTKDKQGLQYLELRLTELLRRLWKAVARPIYQDLCPSSQPSHPPRVWWCPSGLMSFLPIHACGPLDGVQPDLPDLVISSYTPTLSVLLRARGSAPSTSPRVLAIIQPDLPGRAPLPSSMEELRVLQHIFSRSSTFLVGRSGTISTVQDKLPQHNWLHVSTHGRQDHRNPLESSLALHDGPLTLLALTTAHLPHAEFAFLSACYSARGTEWIADESMHLAAGFLFAGYKSIVASSWAIADKDAPRVAHVFYGFLARDGRTPVVTEAAIALHFAVRAPRSSGAPAVRWAPFIHIGV